MRKEAAMFCPECGRGMRKTSEAVKEDFKGEPFEVAGIEHYACDACGETAFDAAEEGRLYTELDRAYRKRKGFLTPEEIKALRKSCGVTQAEFERMLGVKPPTCSRWESGAVLQSPTANQLMWLMRDTPCSIDALKRKAEIPASEPICFMSAERTASPARTEVEYV